MSKYKHLIKLREAVRPNLRILKFKRPKWTIIKNDLKQRFLQNQFFKNRRNPFFVLQKAIITPLKWTRLQQLYKASLQAKVRFIEFYNTTGVSSGSSLNRLGYQTLKRSYKQSSNIFDFVVKFEHRLDIFLYRIGFCCSVAEAQLFLSHRKVWLNGNIITQPHIILKAGDFLSFDSNMCSIIRRNLLNKIKHIQFLPLTLPFFAEINYNTFEIIILEDANENSLNKMSYMFSNFLDLDNLKNYFRRKG